MLNLVHLKPQINKMVEWERQFVEDIVERLRFAVTELGERAEGWEELSRMVEETASPLLLAKPLGPLNAAYPLPARPSDYTLVATDGSQIFPDRHESFPCYLINIGSVVLRYGSHPGASLTSRPTFFYSDEDMHAVWDGRRVPLSPEAISIRRSLMEFRGLLSLARDNCDNRPVMAFSDGTLILFSLESTPSDFRSGVLSVFTEVMDGLRELGVPTAGYISLPGSVDVVNTLGFAVSSEAGADGGGLEALEGVTDKALFGAVLSEGERSGLFMSTSRILRSYGSHAVSFYYLNVGEEIVRVELPRWVAEDPALLNQTHSIAYDQAKKGGGYPVALQEAHEQAVVRGGDREFFFDLLREARVRADLPVRMSRKGLSKRRPRV